MFLDSADTIFALATGARKSAVAVIRVSGPRCNAVLAALAPGAEFPARRAVLKKICDPSSGGTIDSALITKFEAPASFTGEDVIEIGVTGGRAVIAAVVRALSAVEEVRPAEAGEFAWRAFVNGKLDLSSVEGLADLVDAETEAQRQQAQRVAGGALRQECINIRSQLISAMAAVEAGLDFSDVDDVERLPISEATLAIRAAKERVDHALLSVDAASRLREGLSVVIAGPPNVGKSTLMNALAGREVAITSPIAGTTRDAIEVFLDLDGYPVIFVDTAGLHDTEDPIEREGVARAKRRVASADLILWLYERDSDLGEAVMDRPTFLVRTKTDESPPTGVAGCDPTVFRISAKTGEGLSDLLSAVSGFAEANMSSSDPPVLVLERHRRAFRDAQSALNSALRQSTTDLELIAEDLRLAASCMDRLIGRIDVEDVLDDIFSRLCVGK